jgi:hypothetical protein
MKLFSIVYTIILLILIPSSTSADSFLRICTATGNCRICDVIASVVTVGQWLITGAAGLALLVIIWAAFGMITSTGNPEKINESKKQITGALLGLAITILSFQIISWIIFAFVVPADISTPDPNNETAVAETGKQSNLSNLLGKPWWSICDEKDLREKGGSDDDFGSTSDCKYWGDGTICSEFKNSQSTNTVMNICLGGKCINPTKEKADAKGSAVQNKLKTEKYLEDLNREVKEIKNACDFLSAVDVTYENYECLVHESERDGEKNCDLDYTIETGYCPGNSDIVCCVQK